MIVRGAVHPLSLPFQKLEFSGFPTSPSLSQLVECRDYNTATLNNCGLLARNLLGLEIMRNIILA